MTTLEKFAALLPKLSHWRNEVVAWLGITATVAAGLATVLTDADLTSLTGVLAILPAVSALIGRQFAYGAETVKALVPGSRR